MSKIVLVDFKPDESLHLAQLIKDALEVAKACKEKQFHGFDVVVELSNHDSKPYICIKSRGKEEFEKTITLLKRVVKLSGKSVVYKDPYKSMEISIVRSKKGKVQARPG